MQVSFIQKSIVVAFGAVALLGATAGVGQAFGFSEFPGDTSNNIATAKNAGPLDPGTNTITGRLAVNNPQKDLFKFNAAVDGTFSATALGISGVGNGNGPAANVALANPLLTLLNGSGGFLAGGSSIASQLLTAGDYFIRIEALNANPPVRGGGYEISLNFTPTPVPTPALLPGLAALGFGAIRKRKAKAAVA
jgi:hypothetical protein